MKTSLVSALLVTLFTSTLVASAQSLPPFSPLDRLNPPHPPPVWIQSVTPGSGAPGTVVTIRGAQFGRVGWVRFTGALAPTFTRVSTAEIRVVVPAGAQTGPIRLEGLVDRELLPGIPLLTYRAVLATSPLPFTVPPPQGVLRIINAGQVQLVDLRLNGQQQLAFPQVVPPGGYLDFTASPGTVQVDMGAGFYHPSGTREVLFPAQASNTVIQGQTRTVTFTRIAIGLVLEGARGWAGDYLDEGGAPHSATFYFARNGSYSLYNDGSPFASGSVAQDVWSADGSWVEFRVDTSHPPVHLDYPFASFFLRNGPPSWPLIQYVRR